MNRFASHQVSWWSVHELLQPVLHQVNDWPMLGTPAWCSLAHDDPRKWCAVLDGARHWALRVETCQEARCEASHAISASGAPLIDDDRLSTKTNSATSWKALAQEIQRRNGFYAARPWLRRAVEQ